MRRATLVMFAAAASAALAAFACDDGPGWGDGDTDTDTDSFDHDVEIAGGCALADRVGRFEVAQHPGYPRVGGYVKDGVVPLTVLHEEETAGTCTLLRKINPECSPACAGGQICSQEGECIPFPSNVPAGTLEIFGLEDAVSLEPNAVGEYEALDLTNPPFAAGAQVLLHAAGGDVGEFFLDGIGVAPLAVQDNEWVIDRDESLVVQEDLEITWAAAEGDWEVVATLNVDQHGNSPVTMICVFEDTGDAVIPKSILQTFTDWGVSGYATGNLYRRTFDSTQTGLGCVELEVFSRVEADLSVTNHDPTEIPG